VHTATMKLPYIPRPPEAAAPAARQRSARRSRPPGSAPAVGVRVRVRVSSRPPGSAPVVRGPQGWGWGGCGAGRGGGLCLRVCSQQQPGRSPSTVVARVTVTVGVPRDARAGPGTTVSCACELCIPVHLKVGLKVGWRDGGPAGPWLRSGTRPPSSGSMTPSSREARGRWHHD
jgi:hypothetical protein